MTERVSPPAAPPPPQGGVGDEGSPARDSVAALLWHPFEPDLPFAARGRGPAEGWTVESLHGVLALTPQRFEAVRAFLETL